MSPTKNILLAWVLLAAGCVLKGLLLSKKDSDNEADEESLQQDSNFNLDNVLQKGSESVSSFRSSSSALYRGSHRRRPAPKKGLDNDDSSDINYEVDNSPTCPRNTRPRSQLNDVMGKNIGPVFLALFILVSWRPMLLYSTQHRNSSPLPSSPAIEDPNGIGNTWWSHMRHDRSGSVVHNLLKAHALAFANNKTYGGACCIRIKCQKAKFKPNTEEVQNLLQTLKWDKALPYACPPRNRNRQVFNEVWINDDQLENALEVKIFTPEWKRHFLSQMPMNTTKKNTFNVVVHIRRGDVEPCTYPDRYLFNKHYLRLIQEYMRKTTSSSNNNSSLPVQVDIYSESDTFESFDGEDFQDFNVHLDTDLQVAWEAMVHADVLIMSKSAFSYVPAVLNGGTVVYTPFQIRGVGPPLPHWKVAKAPPKKKMRMFRERCWENKTKKGG